MKRRIVITGIGPASTVGIGKETFFNNLLNKKTNIQKIPKCFEKNYTFKSRYFVPKPTFSLADFEMPPSLENIMEETSQLSVLCSKLALEDAGYSIKRNNKYFKIDCSERCCVIIGVGMNSLQTAFTSYAAHISDTDQLFLTNGEKRHYNRLVIPMLMPNASSSWISILFGIKGANYTVNAACASGSLAISQAYEKIYNGQYDVAITGGVEALSEKNGAVMRGFDMLTTLTKSSNGYPLPFSKKRSGFLFNEGAGCVLILEELQHAIKRHANIYAEIADYQISSDAYNLIQIDPDGKHIKSLLKKLTEGIIIDYINAHGTGTISNDQVESKIIQDVFGNKDKQPFINTTKGIMGHSIGASGAIEAGVTAMSIKNEKIHGNITIDLMDNLNLPIDSIEVPVRYAISSSYGFGGHNVVLLLKRYENE